MEDVEQILLELKDDGWYVTNIKNQTGYYEIRISKNKNKEQSKYPKGSEFYYDDLNVVIDRIEMYARIAGFSFCTHDLYYDDPFDGYKSGVWSKFTNKKNEINKYKNKELLGIKILYIIPSEVILKYKDYIK